MQWRKVVEKVRYVQVYDGDHRSYKEKHESSDYLRSLMTMGSNGVFITETQQALEQMRLAKDRAETPEETKGINECLKIMKKLALSPYVAADKLSYIGQAAEMEEEL